MAAVLSVVLAAGAIAAAYRTGYATASALLVGAIAMAHVKLHDTYPAAYPKSLEFQVLIPMLLGAIVSRLIANVAVFLVRGTVVRVLLTPLILATYILNLARFGTNPVLFGFAALAWLIMVRRGPGAPIPTALVVSVLSIILFFHDLDLVVHRLPRLIRLVSKQPIPSPWMPLLSLTLSLAGPALVVLIADYAPGHFFPSVGKVGSGQKPRALLKSLFLADAITGVLTKTAGIIRSPQASLIYQSSPSRIDKGRLVSLGVFLSLLAALSVQARGWLATRFHHAAVKRQWDRDAAMDIPSEGVAQRPSTIDPGPPARDTSMVFRDCSTPMHQKWAEISMT